MTTQDEAPKERTLELWMVSQFTGGMAIQAFAILLIPAFITNLPGSGADAFGFNAINWMAAVVVGFALGLLAVLWTTEKQIRSQG
jgi:uncharacterized membrane protein YqjE